MVTLFPQPKNNIPKLNLKSLNPLMRYPNNQTLQCFLPASCTNVFAISSAPTFDHYTLALQWTPNVFMRQRSCIPQVSRLLTVHGLWPSNIVWPQPPHVGGTCDSFCQRPWEKHGICTPFSQYDYFCHTLYLWYIHNVTVMVDEKNIKPGTPMITNRSTQI
ncbi:ribonuclease T2 family protein [Medicago truncatula]|uniref:Ribonuclease T2 family protein n=1 Tax=Medicago truncatula TaxID=3880 RepID=G7IKH4_MEDTR|nr:ribonuclease T2 family protein [Medicago truncatula]